MYKPDFKGKIVDLIIGKAQDLVQDQEKEFIDEIKAKIKKIECRVQSFELSEDLLNNSFKNSKFKYFIKEKIKGGIKYYSETIKDSKPFNDIDSKVKDFLSILHESLKDNPNKEDYYSNILTAIAYRG